MNICLFSASLEQGGAERVMSVIANEFVRNGHSVTIFTLVDLPIFFDLNENIKIHCLGFENKGPFSRIFNQFKAIFQLRKLLKKQESEVILSFMVKYNIITILATLNTKVKVFVSDRSNPLKELPFVQTFLRKKLYPKATGIIAQTSFAKEIMTKTLGQSHTIKTIHNPIPPFIKKGLLQEKIIISVGRLVKLKGHEILIKAFSKTKNENWKLIILGQGPEQESLQNLAGDLNLEDKVILPGAVKNVNEWLEKSSIFAFTSFSEGFPNALAEAMVAGLPCVSFDCNAGPRDLIINEKNGFLIPVGDKEELIKCLNKLMGSETLRQTIGNKATLISKDLDNKTISQEYLDFFKL